MTTSTLRDDGDCCVPARTAAWWSPQLGIDTTGVMMTPLLAASPNDERDDDDGRYRTCHATKLDDMITAVMRHAVMSTQLRFDASAAAAPANNDRDDDTADAGEDGALSTLLIAARCCRLLWPLATAQSLPFDH